MKQWQWYAARYNNGQLAGMDQASGGYPFETDHPGSIKYWDNLDELKYYIRMFPELHIVKINIEIVGA